MLESEVASANEIYVQFKGHLLRTSIKISLQFDGKLISLLQGCGGAHCTGCPATMEEINNPERILQGFNLDRNIEWNNALYWLLHEEDELHSPNYKLREGMTQEPIFKTLDATEVMSPLHAWIRCLSFLEHILYHNNARDAFPDRRPVWGSGKRKGPVATKAVKDAAEAVRQKAKLPPLKLLLDAPDPHGNGGTTDDGNTARLFFHPKNREGVLDLFDVSPELRETLRKILQSLNTVLRVVNCSQEIKVYYCTSS
jgi:hypothetical protein